MMFVKNAMKRFVLVLISLTAFYGLAYGAPAADPNILIIGSSSSFSDRGESGVVKEKAFNPSQLATELKGILDNDSAISGTSNVVFENIFRTKAMDTAMGGGGDIWNFTFHCYSLMQYYMWPEGKDARLANLRGEGGTAWDYVIIVGDPYLMANMPGVYAEGVKLLTSEISKGTATPILLAQWPEDSSSFSATNFNEIVYRAGSSAGVQVVPAGKAWDGFSSKDSSTSHPTPHGSYLAAASIYSKLYDRSAKTSSYTYVNSSTTTAISDHALSVVQANASATQYTGKYTTLNPFQMKYLRKRTVEYNKYGSSTESGFNNGLAEAFSKASVRRVVRGGTVSDPVDFSYSRGTDCFEADKQYDAGDRLNLDNWTYGFPMGDHGATGPVTMLYGIDKRYYGGSSFYNGTDLGIAYSMIREGQVPIDVHGIPVRLLWAKMNHANYGISAYGDSWHLSGRLNNAVGAYMFTLVSGRCPIEDEPADSTTTAWKDWFCRKIGYETAWQMAHVTCRAPGFRVLPSSASALSVTPSTTDTMTVQFRYPPQSDVTVTITSSDTSVAIVGPQILRFTPTNHDVPQTVTFTGVPGTAGSFPFNIQYSTSSDDDVYDGLTDSWAYTMTRTATSTTHTDNGTTNYQTPKNFPVTTNLGASGASSGNTTFVGPNNGTLAWSSSDVVYTPDANYIGSDGFAFWSLNGSTLTTGYIHINVIDGYPDGSVRAEATDSTATEEGTTTGTWTITREGSTASDLTVNFTLGGSAADGSDYDLNKASPVTIPATKSSITITLTPIDDTVFGEHVETATLTIAPGTGYVPITSPATIGIEDNDNNAPTVDAGQDQTVSLLLGVTSPGLYYGTVTGNIDTTTPNPETSLITNVAAYTEDSIGGNTTEIYTGQIYDADGNISFTEHIDDKARIWIDGNLEISNDSYNTRTSTGNLSLTPGWHDIEIRISNGGGGSGPTASPGIGFDPNGGTAWQTLSDPGDGSLLRVGTPDSVTVNLDGTVEDPEDTPATIWTLVSSTPSGLSVTFGDATAIDTTATFTAAGTYVLRLTADDGYGPIYAEVTITVTDPGVLPEITVTATDASAAEAGLDKGTWTINRSGDTADPLTVYFTFGGTATEPTDYTIDVTSPLTIPANESSVTVTVTPKDDAEKENAETAKLVIGPDAAYTVGASEEITILDDDNIPPVVDAGPDQTVPLTGGPTVMLLAPTDPIQGFQSTAVGGDSTDGSNWPGAESPPKAIDGSIGTKYLNLGKVGSGFYITPATGLSTLTGIKVYTANDVPGRDPLTVSIEGANGGDLSQGSSWTLIANSVNLGIDTDPGRQTAGPLVEIVGAGTFTSYRIIAQSMRDTGQNSIQYSEFELHGVVGSLTIVDLDGTVTDADDPTPTTTWTVVSTVPAGLEATVTFADASAVDTTATFTTEGVYTLRLTVDDGATQTSDTVTITVNESTGTNTAPVASNGSVTTDEDVAVAVTLSATDAEGDTLSYSVVTGPTSGTLSGTAPNLTYTPNAGFFGSDNFAFKANDGTVDSNVATVSITINEVVPANNPPVLESAPWADVDPLTLPATTNVNVVATDADGDPLTFTWSKVSGPGTVAFSPNGTNLSEIASASFSTAGSYVLRVTVSDDADTVSGDLPIEVLPEPNTAPVVDAGTDQTVTLSGTPVAAGWAYAPWTGDTDSGISDGNVYTAAHCFGDNHGGSVTVNGVVFTESFGTSGTGWSIAGGQSNWNGDDNAILTGTSEDLGEEFVYNGKPRTVTFTGLTPGQAYEATFFSVAWETGAREQTFQVVGGDSQLVNQDAYDNNNGIRISCVYIASGTSQDFTITPVTNSTFHLYAMANRETSSSQATASLGGTASDADGDTLTTTWSTVSGPAPVNFADAAAVDTTASFTAAGTYTLRLTANDGSAQTSDDMTITVNEGTATNTAPVASNGSVTTDEDVAVAVTLSATDADGDTLSYSVVTGPTSGTLSGTAPNLTYTPAVNWSGTDSFTFKANDGTVDSNTATVSITVNEVIPPNTAPVANNGSATTNEDTAVAITLSATDADGDTLSYSVVTGPTSGTLSGTGASRTYTPAVNWSGTDSFTFTATDGTDTSNVATVTITVSAVNDAPIIDTAASATPSSLFVGASTTLSVSASDVDGDPLSCTWSKVSGPGTVNFGNAAAETTTATFGTAGSYQLRATLSDGTASVTSDVTVTVTEPVVLSAHVQSITCATSRGSKGQEFGSVTVVIQDSTGQPVAGATVSGSFSGSYSDSVSGATDATGTVTFTTVNQTKKPAYTFTVTNVTHPDMAYEPTDNVETSDSL